MNVNQFNIYYDDPIIKLTCGAGRERVRGEGRGGIIIVVVVVVVVVVDKDRLGQHCWLPVNLVMLKTIRSRREVL
jgi:hypothetical protein